VRLCHKPHIHFVCPPCRKPDRGFGTVVDALVGTFVQVAPGGNGKVAFEEVTQTPFEKATLKTDSTAVLVAGKAFVPLPYHVPKFILQVLVIEKGK
jgi:hypothetical protein